MRTAAVGSAHGNCGNTYPLYLRQFLAKHCADFSDQDAFIAVGDGATPRTAALFAFLSKGGTCFAIDPLLQEGAAKLAKKPSGAGSGTVAKESETLRQQADHNAQFFSKLSLGR